MLSFIKTKKDCTGCTACLAACPVSCITMRSDEEGFQYPEASDACIHCGKCERVCPLHSGKTERIPTIRQYSAAVLTNRADIWVNSASGGAFFEICRAFGDKETVVFGAAFNSDLHVFHKYAIGIENIAEFHKSKYVQSSMENCLREVKTFLDNGRKVIFSGTPCQIAGLHAYLNQEYENLLCIDFICHGVGSPAVFDACIKLVEQKSGCKIKEYTFRSKRKVLYNQRHTSKYSFENGHVKYVVIDEYNQTFLNQLCLRRSCGDDCRFRNSNRQGDITIADFNGADDIRNKIGKKGRSYSSIICNTVKGDVVCRKVSSQAEFVEYDIKYVEKYNPLFFHTTQENKERDDFFALFVKDKDLTLRKYTKTPSASFFEKLKMYVPYSFYPRIRAFKTVVETVIKRISKK